MAECVVRSCKSTDCELFCAPEDKNKLKKWQMLIATKQNDFFVCEKHFPAHFIVTEKSLAANAFPSLFLKTQDYQKESTCQSCLKNISSRDEIKIVGEKFVEIFKSHGYEIKQDSPVCISCHETLSNLQNILIIQEMKRKNPVAIKVETIDLEDDQTDKVPLSEPVEQEVPTPNAKVIVYPKTYAPKFTSTPKDPVNPPKDPVKIPNVLMKVLKDQAKPRKGLLKVPKDTLNVRKNPVKAQKDPVKPQKDPVKPQSSNNEQKIQNDAPSKPSQPAQSVSPNIINFKTLENANLMPKLDLNAIQKKLQNPKLISVNMPTFKAYIKTVLPPPETREYMIPLKGNSDNDKPIITTMRRKSATAMTIIHSTPIDKNKKNTLAPLIVPLKTDIEASNEISAFTIATKRRASVATPTAATEEVVKSPSRELPSKEFRCSECEEPFATPRLLKYHEDNALCDKKSQFVSRTINSFKCFDCNNTFASYYFLRRHREVCTAALRVKCTYQYCRFRATNPGDIQKHFNEVHADKLKCKECDEICTSQAGLIAHEVTKHGKPNPKKRKQPAARRGAKKARTDLDFDSNTLVECEQCGARIHPRSLANHMAGCKN